MIFDNDWTRLEYKLGGCNVGEQVQAWQQMLGWKVVERLRCSVFISVKRLHIKNANQIHISANQIEKHTVLINNNSINYSILIDLKIRMRIKEKVNKLVDIGAANLWDHFKDGILKACDKM